MGILEKFKLDGKVALVTGGAGLYGRQIVEAMAEAGAKTYVASRNLGNLEKLAAECRSKGLEIHIQELDQALEGSVNDLAEALFNENDRVDILINNAVLRPMKGWDAPISQFAESMQANATGIFMMTRAFGNRMAEQGAGSIINVGSMQGMIGPDFTLYEGLGWDIPPDYFFHKGGMLQLTRYAASKLGPKGVRVNTLCPGGFYSGQEPLFVERYNKRTFLERMAHGEDLKGIVVFLASDASAYITGASIPVDAGYTAK
jgi:NAD(P)-dependent dehydrogenase (short-subunit alcohol dehydrogenase family)